MSELQAVRTWLETRPDVEVQRVADATAWNACEIGHPGEPYDAGYPGCLMYHATGNRYGVRFGWPASDPDFVREYLDAVGDAEWDEASPDCPDKTVGRQLNIIAREILFERHEAKARQEMRELRQMAERDLSHLLAGVS